MVPDPFALDDPFGLLLIVLGFSSSALTKSPWEREAAEIKRVGGGFNGDFCEKGKGVILALFHCHEKEAEEEEEEKWYCDVVAMETAFVYIYGVWIDCVTVYQLIYVFLCVLIGRALNPVRPLAKNGYFGDST